MTKTTQFIIWLLAAGAVLAVYFFGLRAWLTLSTRSLVEGTALGVLLLAVIVTLLSFVVVLLALALGRSSGAHLLGRALPLLAALLILAAFLAASQWSAYTPPILAADGKSLPGSIASLEKVRLGGVDQWLIIRGHDTSKPVLLFLSGGPGASEAGRVLRFNQELEKHFVVVIWEQRGCAKSYPSYNPTAALTLEQYTADLIELTNMLRERFQQDKLYLVGHSWGTLPGVRAVQASPDLYHAYVGASQMVDVLETDEMIYDMMMDYSRQTGDAAFVQTLTQQGRPPYLGSNPIGPYSTLFGREYAVYEVPNIKDPEYRRDGDAMLLMLKQPEYGWLDRVYYLLGLMNTFNVVYPQLQDLDLRQDAARFEIPVYIVLGRHDMNNPSQIPEDYYNRLEAPSKQLVYFEDSGHGMIWEEPARYHDLMLEIRDQVIRDQALRD